VYTTFYSPKFSAETPPSNSFWKWPRNSCSLASCKNQNKSSLSSLHAGGLLPLDWKTSKPWTRRQHAEVQKIQKPINGMKHANKNKKGLYINQKYTRINSQVLKVYWGSHAKFCNLPPEQTLVRHPHPSPPLQVSGQILIYSHFFPSGFLNIHPKFSLKAPKHWIAMPPI